MTNDKISYMHIRNITDNGVIDGRGGATVAFRETAPGVIEYAAAFCSPHDNFNKAYGRTKAEGRLASDRFRRTEVGLNLVDFRKVVMDGDFAL